MNQPVESSAPGFGRYELLLVSVLHTDGTYQRPLSLWRVRDIVFNYEPILFQPLIIGLRTNVHYVIDGQHRLQAAKELAFPRIPCMVYDTESVAEEAKAFLWLQKYRRAISPPQQFIAKLAFDDPTATAINALLHKYNFKTDEYERFVNRSTSNNKIFSIGTLERVYDQGGEKLLDRILYILRNAWDGRASMLHRTIIRGLSVFMQNSPYSYKILTAKLSSVEAFDMQTAAAFIGHQRGLSESNAMAAVISNIYHGDSLKKLPEQ